MPFIDIVRKSRATRLAFLLGSDIVLIAAAYYLAFWLRFDAIVVYSTWGDYSSLFLASLPLLIVLRLICNHVAHQYAWSFSHAGLNEAGQLFFAVSIGSMLFLSVNYLLRPFGLQPPRSIYALEGALSLLFMGAVRFLPKYLFSVYCQTYYHFKHQDDRRPTLVYGAGGNAELMVRELLRTTGHPYRLVGFIDDSASKRNIFINGLKVLGSADDLPELIAAHRIKELLIAIPGFSGAPLRKLVDLCSPFGLSFKIIPPYQKVLEARPGNIHAAFEDIKPDALLNRPQIPFDTLRLADFYRGQAALVTGAAGSVGSEICRQLAEYGVRRLILFDVDENGVFFLHNDLRQKYPELELRFEVGSVQNEGLVEAVLAKCRPDIVLHAAAYKHVPIMEFCPVEALRNNVLGTFLLGRAAQKAGIKNFLLISTDKAVLPVSVMGATKRLAEIALNNIDDGVMRATTVRFGNVLGSNGSLLQIIQRQIRAGGPVTITHPLMSRFFMTIPEAIGLVLMTPTLKPADIFVLDMGEAVSVDKLVRHVISLSGLAPDRDIKIVYTDRRPGEKLEEVLLNEQDDSETTEHPGIWAVRRQVPRL
ncbi:MAG: polysaccharide biosynthesis protein, partial [Candidatus Adiutrix sp.]|nr:polysaccharide biosynthesis protein [Candidatus Adiutrix sp.]